MMRTHDAVMCWPLALSATIVTVLACGQEVSEAVDDRSTCETNLGTCTDERSTCETERGTCTDERSTCETNLGTCETNMGTCTDERSTCETNLGTCTDERSTCETERGTCEEERDALHDNQYRTTDTVSNLDLFSPMCSSTRSDKILPDGNLGVFQDSKFGGESQMHWRVNRACEVGTTGSSCCVELHYRFNARRTSTYTPYAGVITYFTYIPFGPIDVSEYDGLGMLVRAEPTTGSSPRVSLQLADIGPNTSNEGYSASCRDGFFEAPIFEFSAGPTTFTAVDVNFTDFARPSWYRCSTTTPLQTHRIYKLAIVFLNTSGTEDTLEGMVQLANLHFR